MTKLANHVIPTHSGWSVRKTGAHRASKIFPTKFSAIKYARKLSRTEGSALFIHGNNGMIERRTSYENSREKEHIEL